MNHREESYLFGKGINVFKVMFSFSLLILLSFPDLYSQNIISRDKADYPNGSVNSACSTSPYSGCIIILPPAKYGESYSFTIPINASVTRSDVNFIFTQKTACSEGGISFTSNGKIEIASASSCRPNTNNFIEFDLKAISSDITDSVKYYLPILRDPVNVVLVLDMSGSMALPVPDGTLTRWQVLNNAVDLFTQKLEVFNQDRDFIGVTYFSTELTQPNSPINEGFTEITSDTDPVRSSSIIHSDMIGRGPTLRTAMGKGLLNAKLKLNENSSVNARKLVLLFTDGLQNVEPLVNPDGVTLSSGSDFLNDGPCASLDSIHYYTIGMGNTTLIPEILGEIAQKNGGISLATTTGDEEGEVEYFFQNQFANMLEGSSPQVVSRETGVLSASGSTYSYPINGNVSKLYFELLIPNASNATFKLEKDGKDLTSLARISVGGFYKTLSISLPLHAPDDINAEGVWNLSVSGTSSEKYSLVCYVDDHFLDFNCQPSKSVYTVGDYLDLKAKISFAGKPLKGDANKVQVMLIRPGDDLGDLLATFKDNNTDSFNDVEPGAETKLLHLIQKDKLFNKKLIPERQLIDLEDEGNGIFKGVYKNTELTGVYQLIYIVNGEAPSFGKFERQKQYSVVFKFGQISTSKTEIKAKIISTPTDKGATATITVKPKNTFGYYLGPGFLSRIKLSVDSNQGIVKSSEDNLDGSYTFTIGNIPQNIKPDVKIMVMGEVLYLGKFPTTKIHFWQFLILILFILFLFLLYVNAHIGKDWIRNLVWVLIILWVAFMILQKTGIISF